MHPLLLHSFRVTCAPCLQYTPPLGVAGRSQKGGPPLPAHPPTHPALPSRSSSHSFFAILNPSTPLRYALRISRRCRRIARCLRPPRRVPAIVRAQQTIPFWYRLVQLRTQPMKKSEITRSRLTTLRKS